MYDNKSVIYLLKVLVTRIDISVQLRQHAWEWHVLVLQKQKSPIFSKHYKQQITVIQNPL